jgi:hypothetical protein
VNWNQKQAVAVVPDSLIAFAWSAPMRELAKKVNRSDVGLRKLLQGYGVPIPAQGHWNRVHAGKSVPQPPKARTRQPGERPYWVIDPDFEPYVDLAPELHPDGPFAAPGIPEDLNELHGLELHAVGRVTVPRDLSSSHAGLRELLTKEERRRAKKAASPYSWTESAHFEGAMNARRLRLLNALMLALSKRGHGGRVSETHDGRMEVQLRVGATSLRANLEPSNARPQNHNWRQDISLPATTPLTLKLEPRHDGTAAAVWSDTKDAKLEARLTEMAASIIVEGERSFRRGIREAIERHEAHMRWLEQERQKRIAAAQAKRVEELRRSGEMLRQAEDIRALVARVRTAMASGEELVPADKLSAWEAWASAYADSLDPIKTGQVMTHLDPQEVD